MLFEGVKNFHHWLASYWLCFIGFCTDPSCSTLGILACKEERPPDRRRCDEMEAV